MRPRCLLFLQLSLLLFVWDLKPADGFVVISSHVAKSIGRSAPSTPRSPSRPNGQDSTVLEASPVVSAIASPIGSVGLLAFVVLIHELGHYSLAKRLGIAVEEFSVGFGPKVLGFTARGDDFNLRAIPLGGYVRFPENYNITQAQEVERQEFQAQGEYMQTTNKSVGWKILNIFTLGILEDREWVAEKRRRKQEAADAVDMEKKKSVLARLFGPRKPKPKATFGDDIEYYDDPNLLQNRPWFERAQVICGGVLFNLLLAFAIFFGQINVGPGLSVPKIADGILITAQPAQTAAARGVLNKGDVIISVNGESLSQASSSSSPDRALATSRGNIDAFIAKVRSTEDGQPLSMSVLREGKPKDVKVTPQRRDKQQTIGVLLAPNVKGTEKIQSKNPVEAARLATTFVSNLTTQTAQGLFAAFSSLLTGSGSAQLSGPVGLIKEGSAVVQTRDLSVALLFAATISVNLAVLNSLPIPALDGGQLVFIMAEAVTGRKVDQKLQEQLTSTAVLLLLGLSLTVFLGDLTSLSK